MRYAFAAILIVVSLVASPVQAKGSGGFIANIPNDFTTGAKFYFETVGGWVATLLDLLGLTDKLRVVGEGADCEQGTRCTLGHVCANSCDGADCDVYAKRCLKGLESVRVLGEYSLCGTGDLCADTTFCTRTCPAGADCGGETHRCMKPNAPSGSCTIDADCRALCGKTPLPPIGPSAWRASCSAGSCTCAPIAIKPSAARVICPTDASGAMLCPTGTHEACTPAACASGICPPYLTCVDAPEYGGTCFADAECADAACAEGGAPFCDASDRRCKCRSTQVTTIACATASDCQAAAVCGTDEVHSCVQGACACAPAGVVTACSNTSDCAACPSGFGPTCEQGQCGCQRITENVPVACASVDDCGGVSCPANYDKACIDAKCACTRTIPQ